MLFWQLWNCKKLSEDILQKEIVSKLKIYVDDTELKYQPLNNQLFCVFNITMNKLISLIILYNTKLCKSTNCYDYYDSSAK